MALSISSIESTQAFIFYLVQYSISNLNIFFILITIGFSLSFYYSNNKEYRELLDTNNSPLKGYFYLNPILALSFTITIFSFVGIPPLIGFFAKQMVLSAALDKGYFFLVLIAIITSVISAGYYLNIIKEIFFYYPHYTDINKIKNYFWLRYKLLKQKKFNTKEIYLMLSDIYKFKLENSHIHLTKQYIPIYLSSVLSIIISVITLTILLFIFINKE